MGKIGFVFLSNGKFFLLLRIVVDYIVYLNELKLGMKFVLVNPGFLQGGMAAVFQTAPLGLLNIAGAITEAGDHDVKIIDTVVDKKTPKQLLREFNKADVVGVSSLTSSFLKAKSFCEIAKEAGATTIMGGFQPTLMPDVVRFPEIDAIVRGEGEITMKRIVQKMAAGQDWRHTKGVSYYDRDLGESVNMPDRPLCDNLDLLPFPRWDLVSQYHYRSFGVNSGLLETSRGCNFGCSFCCVTKVYGRSWRAKSINRVIEEHRRLPKNVKWLFNVDDNYVMNPKRAMELSNRLVQEGLNTKSMIIQARADALARHPRLLDALQASGVRLVFIGVESVHPRELKLLNKGVKTAEYIQQAFDGLHDRGIAVWASIISGVQDKFNDAREALDCTIDFLLEKNVEIMQCTSLTAYPSTSFYEEAVQRGWVTKINLEHPELTNLCPDRPELSREQMKILVERAFHRFYLTPKYFLKLSKWRNLLDRKWFWLYNILGKFIKVGVVDFILGTLLNKKLWENQKVETLANQLLPLTGSQPEVIPAITSSVPSHNR